MADPLLIKQGTTREVVVNNLRDGDGNPLDPTGWAIHAVARTGVWGPIVQVWRDTPGTDEGLAEVTTGTAGEKVILLHITPAMSDAWTWHDAVVDIEVHEPPPGSREEAFTAQLQLVPTTVQA